MQQSLVSMKLDEQGCDIPENHIVEKLISRVSVNRSVFREIIKRLHVNQSVNVLILNKYR